MKAPPSRRVSPPGAIALFCAGLATGLLGAALMTATVQPPQEPALAVHDRQPMPDIAGLHPHDATDTELDALRQSAALGNPLASLALVGALLERSDDGQPGDTAALFEATHWLQRDWDTPEFLHSGLLQRVAHKHCPANPLLKWYWLCDTGE